MILTLAWLTVSTSFIYETPQQEQTSAIAIPADEDLPGSEENIPLSNSTEEKTGSTSLNLSEYLHHIHEMIHLSASLHKHDCSHNYSVYVAFHGELLCPPPNFILS